MLVEINCLHAQLTTKGVVLKVCECVSVFEDLATGYFCWISVFALQCMIRLDLNYFCIHMCPRYDMYESVCFAARGLPVVYGVCFEQM